MWSPNVPTPQTSKLYLDKDPIASTKRISPRKGNMELDFAPILDVQSLSGATLAEEDEMTAEHDELLGAGSSE